MLCYRITHRRGTGRRFPFDASPAGRYEELNGGWVLGVGWKATLAGALALSPASLAHLAVRVGKSGELRALSLG